MSRIKRLENSLLDLTVIVGINEHTGLSPCHVQPFANEVYGSSTVYNTAYEAQVLASVSAQVASFSFETPGQHQPYPPHLETGETKPASHGSKKNQRVHISRNGSMRATHSSVDMAKRGRYRDSKEIPVKSNDLPLSPDVLQSLPTMCFPDMAFVRSDVPDDRVHFLVLTDLHGNKSYAACLTYYLPYSYAKTAESNGDGPHTVPLCPATNPDDGACLYAPMCVVFISKFPYFTLLKDLLSRLASRLKADPEELAVITKEFTLQLTMTPVPPAGPLSLEVFVDQCLFVIPAAHSPYRPVCDLPLYLLKRRFSTESLLLLISCVLTQQKLVFMSTNYSMLTVAMEGVTSLIYPLRWQFTYVPVLPCTLLDYLESPGTFMFGCHGDNEEKISEMEDVVLVDVDSGHVTVGEQCHVSELPAGPARVLTDSLNSLDADRAAAMMARPTTFYYEDEQKQSRKFVDDFNSHLKDIFLQFMVSSFRDVLLHIKSDRMFFNKEQYLESVLDQDQSFYTQMVETSLFRGFLKDRLNEVKDDWTVMEEKTRPSVTRRGSYKQIVLPDGGLPNSRSSLSNLKSGSRDKTSCSSLRLPNFNWQLSLIYFQKCIEVIVQRMNVCVSSLERASCLYLRGLLNAALCKKLQCLEDLHSLRACDKRLFPRSVAVQLVHSLSSDERDRFHASPFYTHDALWRQLEGSQPAELERSVTLDFDKIPKDSVDLLTFIHLMKVMEIVTHHDTVERLFQVLRRDGATTVDPVTLELFYASWKELEVERKAVELEDAELDEELVKLSRSCRSSMGTGRLAATNRRLLFFREGSHSVKQICRFSAIERIEKCKHSSLFTKQTAALRVHIQGAESFVASLKEHRNHWHRVITELWSGKRLADSRKDISILFQAEQNTLLVDALIESGQYKESAHNVGLTAAADSLCYYSKLVDQGYEPLTKNTTEALQSVVDPNHGEDERRTVECLLYTAGNRSSLGQDVGPRLWCGMGSGKLRVFDASTWRLLQECVKAAARIVTLMAVEDLWVWAGSFDRCIYVVDTRSNQCYQTLAEHRDSISDLCLTPDCRSAFSCGLDGQLVTWNTRTLTGSQLTKLDTAVRRMTHHRDQLWLCAKSEIMVLEPASGDVIRRFVYQRDDVIAEQLESLVITTRNEVWVGCSRIGQIAVLSADDVTQRDVIEVPASGVTSMLVVDDKVWVGTKDGVLCIFDLDSHRYDRELAAHSDYIRSLTHAQSRYVMSGAGSRDGKVAIWRNLDESLA